MDLGGTLRLRIGCPFYTESSGSLSTSPLPSCSGMLRLNIIGICCSSSSHIAWFLSQSISLFSSTSSSFASPLSIFIYHRQLSFRFMNDKFFDVYHLSSIPIHLSVVSHFAHLYLTSQTHGHSIIFWVFGPCFPSFHSFVYPWPSLRSEL